MTHPKHINWYWIILRIMPLDGKLHGTVYSCRIDAGNNTICALIKHRQNLLVDIVVNKNNPMLCALYELHDQFKSIKNLSVKEHAFIRQLRRFNYHIKLLVMFVQMILHRRQPFILFFQTNIYLPLHGYHLLMKCITSE